jgi:hypothetical protein
MKQLRKFHTEKLPPTILYLDDIERIYNILTRYATEVSIKTKDYALDSPKHLPELKQEYINELRFYANEPFIQLSLLRDGAEMVVYDDDPHAMAAVSDIRRIINSRIRLIGNIWLRVALLLTLPVVFSSWIITNLQYIGIYELLQLGLFIIAMVIVAHIYGSRFSTILLSYKIDSPSWWKRNQDNLIVGIILVIVGIVIGYVFSKVFGA